MIEKIDHIGIAVRSIEEQSYYYSEILGLGRPKIEIITEQKVKTAMFQVGEVKIELLEPTSNDSPVAKFMARRGEGIHHIAMHVDDLENHIKRLKEHNIQLIDDRPRMGMEGQVIAFVHPGSTFGVLTEFCQSISK